ncbi:response regulator transcription factor [uncultured Pelagimonas sp.]|uniref:response regulator transcription factor n=1 Tax=uncultured Pelagimonas sp. TaxID=1618102 RepID=UPI00262F2A81|nr:response regulator transcription factor [uncultured Pelagimonas sp.]
MESRPIRLAIIDDHAIFLQGLFYVFERSPLDLDVRSFTTATDFLQETDNGQTWDVVITDLAMKPFNGIALIGALRARNIGVQVIVLSASEDAITRTNAQMVGAFRFVHKSCEEHVLLDAITAAFAEGPLPAKSIENGARRTMFQSDGTDTVVRPKLGPQQQRILSMMAEGSTNKDIARALTISENTVKTHAKTIFRELSVGTRAAAVQRARELALF